MSATSLGLILVPLTPVLLALCWCIPRLRAPAGALIPWAPLPALLLAVFGVLDTELRMQWLLLGSIFGLDGINSIFLGFTSILWIGAGLYARGYMANDTKLARFDLLWLATMAGNLGLILSRDIASFYVFFALMTFAAYGLVIHERSTAALRAGKVYLVMAMIGEGLILTGLLLAAQWIPNPLLFPALIDVPASVAASRHRDLIFGCLWLGFGIKAGLPLLHLWLPLAHPVAPVPASAVLSGAMIKAGLLGWMNTLPLGIASLDFIGKLVIVTGLVAAFGAALIGIHQRTPKTVLAYSSISQMGLITMGVGVGLYSSQLWPILAPILALYALHHGLAKGALFLGVGIAQHAGGPIRPWLWMLLAMPGLALVGLTISGMASKLGLKDAIYIALISLPDNWQWLPYAFAVAAIGTTLLIARYLWLLNAYKPGEIASRSEWTGWALILIISTLGFVLLPIAGWGGRWPDSTTDFFDLVWPAAVGVALSLTALRLKLRAWKIPAGDLLPTIERLLRIINHTSRRAGAVLHRRIGRVYARTATLIRYTFRHRGFSILIEHFWRRDAALVFAAVLMALVILLT